MRDTLIIFLFELKNRLQQKSIIITTLIFAALAFAGPFVPRIAQNFIPDEGGAAGQGKGKPLVVGFINENGQVNSDFIKASMEGYEGKEYKDLETMKEDIKSKKVESGFVFKDEQNIDGYYRNQGLSIDEITQSLMDKGQSYLRDENLKERGIDPQTVKEAEEITLEVNPNSLGRNAQTGFIAGYIGMFVIYMTVILFGNQVATLVAREKSDRTMEILITTTKPTGLIVGKVFATAIISVMQMSLIILALFVGYKLNISYYPPGLLKFIQGSFNAKVLGVFMVYYILGLLLYLFLFASLGALVSKVEEVANAVGPVSVIIIFSFIVTNFTMQTPESPVLRIASLIPFSSPMAFFTRYTLTSIPVIDFIISLGLLILTIILLAYISIKIYRLGTLNYGNRIKFFKALRMIMEKDE
mgnify:CR=1 FL=1